MLIDATLVAHDIRAISVRAKVDPRTVENYLAGKNVYPLSRMRIEEALLALGYAKVAP